jgi:hypothetical protein
MKDFFFRFFRNQTFLMLLAGGVIAAGLWLSRPQPKPLAQTPEGGHVSILPGSGFWAPVPNVRLSDAQALAFAPDRQAGFFLAADGKRFVTSDGGQAWSADLSSPLTEENFEKATAGGFTPNNSLFFATGLDESAATSVYELQADVWKPVFEGDYGGIAGASADGSVLAGGAGLVILREGDGWTPRRIDQAKNLTLYAAARAGARIVCVGEYGAVFQSRDAGRSWTQRQAGVSPLYAVALVGDALLVGGANGALWRDGGRGFGEITGLDRGLTITALAADGSLALAGGELKNGQAVLFSSVDGAVTWHLETLSAPARLVGIAFGARGAFAAALTGELYLRQSLAY